MSRRAFLLIPIALASSSQVSSAGHFDERIFVEFLNIVLKFCRKLWSCPENARSFEDCRPIRGSFDSKLWSQLCDKFNEMQ